MRLHATFVLFLDWIFVSNYASSGATIAWNGLPFVVLSFLCVLPHEFGQIFTARAFGVPSPYVTLLPIDDTSARLVHGHTMVYPSP